MKVSHCFKPDLDIYPNKTIVTKLFEAQTSETDVTHIYPYHHPSRE